MRARALVAAVGGLCLAAGGAPPHGLLDGQGPISPEADRSVPYLLGWTAEVAVPSGLLRTPQETGGVAVDGRTGWVYVGTSEGRVLCLVEGRVRWDVDVGGPVRASPTLFEERLVVGTGEGVLVSLNKVTGERLGRVLLAEELVTRPVVARGEDGIARAFVGSSGESLFAVDVELGQKLWRAHRDAPTPFSAHGFAAPVLLGDVVFAGFADGVVEAREVATGKVPWERRLSPSGDLVDVDGLATDGVRLFAASASGGLFALDPSTGGTRWREPMRGAGRVSVDGARVFVSGPGMVRAFRTGDGVPLWSVVTGERMNGSPVVAGEAVAAAEDDGPVRLFDPASGRAIGQLPVAAADAPATLGRAMFLLSNSGRVYSLAIVR